MYRVWTTVKEAILYSRQASRHSRDVQKQQLQVLQAYHEFRNHVIYHGKQHGRTRETPPKKGCLENPNRE